MTELYRERASEAHLETLPSRLSEFAIVAEKGGGVVGFLLAEKRRTRDGRDELGRDAFPQEEEYLEIQESFVDPAHRNKGIGTPLMREVLSRGEAAGLKRSMVYSGNTITRASRSFMSGADFACGRSS
jgi:ribosomal protein S18 acetylase RimI-like enzyme